MMLPDSGLTDSPREPEVSRAAPAYAGLTESLVAKGEAARTYARSE